MVTSHCQSPGGLELAGELLDETELGLPWKFTPMRGASTNPLAHNARLFDKGTENSSGSYNVFTHLKMSFALISLSSKLKMAGLTPAPFCFCLGKKVQYQMLTLGISGHVRVILACENSSDFLFLETLFFQSEEYPRTWSMNLQCSCLH